MPAENESTQPPGGLAEAQRTELQELMRQNKKIEAIKRYREITGLGLAEAKAAVETLAEGGELAPPLPPKPLTPAQEQELVALLQRQEKMAAIKKYREFIPGTELMIARLQVEALAAKHGIRLSSKCFIATAVFGPDSPEVMVLRDWRDARLAGSTSGRLLIRLYGLAGPPLAELTRSLPFLRRGFRAGFSRWVDYLVRPRRG